MRYLLAAFVFAHAVAHLPGFAVTWRLLDSPELPYATTILGGRVDLGERGIRAAGLLWLVLAGVMGMAALAAAGARPGWTTALGAAAAGSLFLTLCFLLAARIGMAVNLLILLGLAAGARMTRG